MTPVPHATPEAPSIAYIGLGGNLPFGAQSVAETFAAALAAIAAAGPRIRALSSLWESSAWPPSDQPAFLNAAAAFDVGDWPAERLYALMAETETRFGRVRDARWAARTLDLDLLDFNGQAGEVCGLILPHPRLHERGFALQPLLEIAPDWVHPGLGRPGAALLEQVLPGSYAHKIAPLRIASAVDGD